MKRLPLRGLLHGLAVACLNPASSDFPRFRAGPAARAPADTSPVNDERDERLTLELLGAIEEGGEISQRRLAKRLGVALGLANSYLRRCVRKGLIKVQHAPANRYLYYLTPQGFAEKSRLTAQYLAASFSFYRKAGRSCLQALRQCRAEERTRIVLAGASELGEIAALRADEAGVEIVATYDPESERTRFAGKPLWSELAASEDWDAVLLTELNDPVGRYQALVDQFGSEAVVVPDVLGQYIKGPERG